MRTQSLIWSLLAVAALICGGPARGDALELDVSGDTFRADYSLSREAKGLEFDFGWLHASSEGDVASAGLHLLGLAGQSTRPMVAAIGGRLLFLDGDADDGLALGLGGYLQYRFRKIERLELMAQLYYAPDVLGFSGTEKYFEAGVRASYRVHERAAVYLGWRTVEVDFKDSTSQKLDDGLHFGVRLRF